MNGILAVNHFLRGEKFDTLHNHLLKTARKMGIDLTLKTNLELATRSVQADFVLFWDKDINLARRLEFCRIPVFNCANAIEKCDDKARTYLELLPVVKQPGTLIAPKSYFESDMRPFVDRAIEILGLPLVFKECFGSFGMQVYLCKSREDILSHITQKPFLLQEFIEKSAGRDKRLEIIDGRCAACVRRENNNDFRANVTNAGKMTFCTPSSEEIHLAVDACKKLGLLFGGVDILDGGYVCEVNSNAHIINIMKATGIDAAPLIFDAVAKRL